MFEPKPTSGDRRVTRHYSILSSAEADVEACREQFQKARPFRHLVIENFFEADFAEMLLSEFPAFDYERARNEFGEIGGKAVNEAIASIGPAYAILSDYLKSPEFLHSLGELTGIRGLLPDPHLFGGGTHENRHGQELDPHVDFNYDPHTKLHRRLNLLVYLNKEWDDDWGGAIQLHSDPRHPDNDQITSFAPSFNRALIFETNEYSWHGFPKIDLPEDKRHLSRKSISIYLYSRDRPAHEIVPEHGTFYVQRPLPPRIQPGYVLSADDIRDLKSLLIRRDGWIEHYQREQTAATRRLDELNRLLQLLKSNSGLKAALARSLRYRFLRFLGRNPA